MDHDILALSCGSDKKLRGAPYAKPHMLLVRESANQHHAIGINIKDHMLDKSNGLPYNSLERLLKQDMPSVRLESSKVQYFYRETRQYLTFAKDTVVPASSFGEDGKLCILLEPQRTRSRPGDFSPTKKSKSPQMPTEIRIKFDEMEEIYELCSRLLARLMAMSGEMVQSNSKSIDTSDIGPVLVSQISENNSEEQNAVETTLLRHVSLGELNSPHSSSLSSMKLTKQFSTPGRPSERLVAKAQIDATLLYTAPLIETTWRRGMDIEILLNNDDFPFRDEIFDLTKLLMRSPKALTISAECVAYDQFIKALSKQPTVLYLMCHSEWDPVKKELNLCFENNKLELVRVGVEDLKRIVLNKLERISLLILATSLLQVSMSAYRDRENIVSFFLSRGVKSVLLIDHEHKLDSVQLSRWITKEVFSCLGSGKSIHSAVTAGKEVLKKKQPTEVVCCCFHPHKKNCWWLKRFNNLGHAEAHTRHVFSCDCPGRFSMVHKVGCQETVNFKRKGALSALIESSDCEERVCCCSPELDHDYLMKVKLHCKDKRSNYGDIIPYDNLENGISKFYNNLVFSQPCKRDQYTLGLEKLVRNLYLAFTSKKRVVALLGEAGCGKAPLAKQTANFLIERKKITGFLYINMDRVGSLSALISRLNRGAGHYSSKPVVDQLSRVEEELVILENMDVLLMHQGSDFSDYLKNMLETTNLNFLLICKAKEAVSGNQGTIWKGLSRVEEVFRVPGISPIKAARLFQILTKGAGNIGLSVLAGHPVFRVNKGERLKPRRVFHVAYLYSKWKDLDEVEDQLTMEEHMGSNPMDDKKQEAVNLITEIKFHSSEYLDIIIFISFFVQGLRIDGLEEAAVFLKREQFWIPTVVIFSRVDGLEQFTEEYEVLKNDIKELQEVKGLSGAAICTLYYKELPINMDQGPLLRIHSMDIINAENLIVMTSSSFWPALLLAEIDPQYTLFTGLLKAINYLRHLLTKLLRATTPYGGERLLEATSRSYVPCWGDHQLISNNYLSKSKTEAEANEILDFHEANIRALFAGKDYFSIIEGAKYVLQNTNYLETYFSLVEDVSIKILTAYGAVFGYVGGEMAGIIRKFISDVKDLGYSMKRMDLKTELLLLVRNCRELQERKHNSGVMIARDLSDQFEQHFRIVEGLLHDYEGEHKSAFTLEFLVAKTHFYNLQKQRQENTAKKIAEKSVNALIEFLDSTKTEEELELLKSKARLLLVEICLRQSQKISDRHVTYLKKCLTYFRENHFERLTFLTVDLLLRVTPLPAEDRGMAAELGLEMIRSFKKTNPSLEFKIESENFLKVSKEYHRERTYMNNNKIVFMGRQSIDFNKKRDESKETIKRNKDLKSVYFPVLEKSRKAFMVRFEEYSKERFQSLVIEPFGAKLCIIDGLINFRADIGCGTFAESSNNDSPVSKVLRKSSLTVANTLSQTPIDILLILGSLDDLELANYIERGVANISIYMSPSIKADHQFDLTGTWMITEFKYTFASYFLETILAGGKVELAIAESESLTIEHLKKEMKQQKIYRLVSESSFQEIQIEIENYFANAIQFVVRQGKGESKLNLREGNIIELKDENITMPIFTFKHHVLHRDHLIFSVSGQLKDRNVINIYGKKGIGKTTFLKVLMNQFNLKETFPEGVFFFELKKYAADNPGANLRPLLSKILGPQFDKDPAKFLNKKLLIAIDDFDEISEGRLIFPIQLVKIFQTCQASVIFTSLHRMRFESIDSKAIHHIRLPQLKKDKALLLLLAIQANMFFRVDEERIRQLAQSRIIKEAKGNPSELVKRSLTFLLKELRTIGADEDHSVCMMPETAASNEDESMKEIKVMKAQSMNLRGDDTELNHSITKYEKILTGFSSRLYYGNQEPKRKSAQSRINRGTRTRGRTGRR